MPYLHLSTPRLTGAPRSLDDVPELRRPHTDERVMATLSADGQPLSAAQTYDTLLAGVAHWERYGFGIWTFRTREDGTFIGYAGLKHTVAGGPDEVELLYAVGSWAWRRGYAVEMAQAVIDAASGVLNLNELIGFTLPHNTASRRVLETCGFSYERDIVHAGLAHVLYRLRRASLPEHVI